MITLHKKHKNPRFLRYILFFVLSAFLICMFGACSYDKPSDVQAASTLTETVSSPAPESPATDVPMQNDETKLEISLIDAIEIGKISVDGIGQSIQSSTLSITNKTDETLEITILPGTFLYTASDSVQNMLIIQKQILTLEGGRQCTQTVSTACMNIYRNIPDESNTFAVRQLDSEASLVKLLELTAKEKSPYPVIQAAVWILTDSASFEATGILVNTLGNGRVISRESYDKGVELAAQARVLGSTTADTKTLILMEPSVFTGLYDEFMPFDIAYEYGIMEAVSDGIQEGDFIYLKKDGEAHLALYIGSGGDVTIPDALGDMPVTAICSTAFSLNAAVTSVEIPDSVWFIDDWAFYGCENLKMVSLNAELINPCAFTDCKNLTLCAPEGSAAESYAEEADIPFAAK